MLYWSKSVTTTIIFYQQQSATNTLPLSHTWAPIQRGTFTQAQKIVVWKLSVSLQNLRWNFIFILLRLLFSKNFGFCCLTFLRGQSWLWLVKRFTPCGQPTNQRCPLKQAESCWTFHYDSITFCKDGDDTQQKGRQSWKMFFNFAQNSQKRPALNWKHSKLIIFYI